MTRCNDMAGTNQAGIDIRQSTDERILSLVRGGVGTAVELRRAVGLSAIGVSRYLRRLVEAGKLRRTAVRFRHGAGYLYSVPPEVRA